MGAMKERRLDAAERSQIKDANSPAFLATKLDALETKTDKQRGLLKEIGEYRKNRVTLAVIDLLCKYVPHMFYTSHYDRIAGEISQEKLAADKRTGSLFAEDTIFLDFLEYAGTSIGELKESSKYEDLKAQCEGASNEITDENFEFWSQNEVLSVQIDLGEGRPDDSEPFDRGTVVKIRIKKQNHRAPVPLS